MAGNSTIEWTEATWNPIAGCSIVSPGCTNCYAMRRVAPRLSGNPATPHYHGTVQPSKPAGPARGQRSNPVWTGKIGIASDQVLTAPLRWKRPRMIFVNSTSDLFHPGVPDEIIIRVFAVMALAPQHTYQLLTKRPQRMREFLSDGRHVESIYEEVIERTINGGAKVILIGPGVDETKAPAGTRVRLGQWPLPQVWLGTSVEDQTRADERIPELLQTPAAVRFISAEPLLGPINLNAIHEHFDMPGGGDVHMWESALTGKRFDIWAESDVDGFPRLDWVIVGGESGNGARPMHPDWARSLRDQCAAAGVPFFFKQWGEWEVALDRDREDPDWRRDYRNDYVDEGRSRWLNLEGGRGFHGERFHVMRNVGKHAAGRLLDGIEHNGMPGRAA